MKATKKPVTIEFFTFEEFAEIGRQTNPDSIQNGFAWHFDFKGHPITHENNDCYIVPTNHGHVHFTPDSVLIVQVDGEVYPCKKDIFEMTYDINDSKNTDIKELSLEEATKNLKQIFNKESDIDNSLKSDDTFDERLKKEFKELHERATKLYSFVNKHDFVKLVGEKQADLLLAQYQCMNSYLTILGIRMKDLNIEIPQN